MADSDDARREAVDGLLPQGRSGAPDPHRVRGVRPPAGWVPELGVFMPPPGTLPPGMSWRFAVGVVIGVIAAVIVGGPFAAPDPWPFVAAIVPVELGLVWAMVHGARAIERQKARHAELFGPPPRRANPVSPFSGHARRVVVMAAAACLVVGAVAGAAVAVDGYARLGVLIGIASVVVAMIAFTASAWWSLRSPGRKV